MERTPPEPRAGVLRTFGYPDAEVHVTVQPRTLAWRASRAGVFIGGGVLVAPVVALVPPHAAWALGALTLGLVLGLRRWRERATVTALRGACPRCGTALSLDRPVRLRPELSVPCPRCRHTATLEVPSPPGSP
ncbi:MAG: hypothetical protein RQ751_03065 [Longimicrobiales bacterium]|nr:hypothetical protein [Longimicrobiales bacterium]